MYNIITAEAVKKLQIIPSPHIIFNGFGIRISPMHNVVAINVAAVQDWSVSNFAIDI